MRTYMIGHFDVTDEAAYGEYSRLALPLVERHGGEVIVSDRTSRTLEGAPIGMVMVLAFPTEADALGFYNDPDYAPVRPIRLAATTHHSVTLSPAYAA